MSFTRALREYMCSRLGHNRVVRDGQAHCIRCGNTRPLYGPGMEGKPPLMDAYLDETDPDPV